MINFLFVSLTESLLVFWLSENALTEWWNPDNIDHSSNLSPPLSSLFKVEGTEPTKNPKKGGIEKLLRGRRDSVEKGGMLLVWVFS